MYPSRNDQLFTKHDLAEFLALRHNLLAGRLTRISEADLRRDSRELAAELLFGVPVQAVRLKEDRKQTLSEEVLGREEIDAAGVIHRPGMRVAVTIPFTGDAKAFDLRPPGAPVGPYPAGRVQYGELTIAITFVSTPSAETVREWYQAEIATIRRHLEAVNAALASFAEQAAIWALNTIEQRRSALLELRSFRDSLDLDGERVG